MSDYTCPHGGMNMGLNCEKCHKPTKQASFSAKQRKRQAERNEKDFLIFLHHRYRKERERRIGTIMLLAHDECITHSRAAELCDMTDLQWRRAWGKMVKEYKP